METLDVSAALPSFVVSSKPMPCTRYAAATRRADAASSTNRSSKRARRTVSTVGAVGFSHGAVRFTMATM
eukprot:2786014-Prymnesium_polylepis.2